MKKNTRTLIILLLSFIAIIVVASVAYNALRESAEPVPFNPQMVVPSTIASPEAVMATAQVKEQSEINEAEEIQASAEEAQEEEIPLEESQEPKMPNIPFYTLQGVETSFEEIRQGRPVVINYWASWCPPCKEELPHFQKAYDTYGEEISFIFLNALDGQRETLQTVTKFINDFKFTGPVFYDNGLFAYIFQTTSLPTTVFFNADGTVAGGQLGYMSESALQRNIDLLLK